MRLLDYGLLFGAMLGAGCLFALLLENPQVYELVKALLPIPLP